MQREPDLRVCRVRTNVLPDAGWLLRSAHRCGQLRDVWQRVLGSCDLRVEPLHVPDRPDLLRWHRLRRHSLRHESLRRMRSRLRVTSGMYVGHLRLSVRGHVLRRERHLRGHAHGPRQLRLVWQRVRCAADLLCEWLSLCDGPDLLCCDDELR